MTRCPIFTAALLLACASPLLAKNPIVSLREGDTAPVFSGIDDNGKTWNSADHIGRNVVVVYFYPADMTSVCTRQAWSFRDHREELRQAGIKVVGVSGDSVKNHQLFKKVHSLNFPLLADVDGEVAKAFGVPVRAGGEITRVVDGKPKKLVRGVTARRWTFVIGLDGTIMNRNTDVQAATDGKSILKLVRHLTASTQ